MTRHKRSAYQQKIAGRGADSTGRPSVRAGNSLSTDPFDEIVTLYFQRRIGRGKETALEVRSLLMSLLQSNSDLTAEWLHGAVCTFTGCHIQHLREHIENERQRRFRYRSY